jgi:hypothetical protein
MIQMAEDSEELRIHGCTTVHAVGDTDEVRI